MTNECVGEFPVAVVGASARRAAVEPSPSHLAPRRQRRVASRPARNPPRGRACWYHGGASMGVPMRQLRFLCAAFVLAAACPAFAQEGEAPDPLEPETPPESVAVDAPEDGPAPSESTAEAPSESAPAEASPAAGESAVSESARERPTRERIRRERARSRDGRGERRRRAVRERSVRDRRREHYRRHPHRHRRHPHRRHRLRHCHRRRRGGDGRAPRRDPRRRRSHRRARARR